MLMSWASRVAMRCFFQPGDDGGFAFPEHAVVYEQQVGLLGGGVFDGGAAGGYGSDDAVDVAAAFDLQAVGGVVLVKCRFAGWCGRRQAVRRGCPWGFLGSVAGSAG